MSQLDTMLGLAGLIIISMAQVCHSQGHDAHVSRATSQYFVYFGTCTGPTSQGIYVSRFNAMNGKLTPAELAAQTPNPMFLAVHPALSRLVSSNRPVLYALNEHKDGTVTAFSINKESGQLKQLNQVPSRGDSPCHVSVDSTEQCVLVANYSSGTIGAFPIQPDGSLEPAATFFQHGAAESDQKQRSRARAHWIAPDPANDFVLACDLGLDQVLVYKFDPSRCSLVPNTPAFASLKAGSGPRHLAFHPKGRFAYVINEMASTMTVFEYDGQKGELKEIQTLSTLPADFEGKNTTAEVQMHPSGRYLYGSNRGHDSIVAYAVDPGTGRLTLVEHQATQGKTPRYFTIDPTGQWLLAANQATDNAVVFRIDSQTGRLSPTVEQLKVGAPVCISFVRIK